MAFKIHSPFQPAGDQPEAIQRLVEGLKQGPQYQTLLGVTGSGKTFTVANVIAQVQKPTLVISHNKALAAQLYSEFRTFFPDNCVEYFISYYDYYQPEAYLPATDMYIEKDASINQEIERLRLRATSALLTRPDVVIVASVSCIYNIGSPDEIRDLTVIVEKNSACTRDGLLERLVAIQYQRNDLDFARGTFRVRGDTVDIRPADETHGIRLGLLDDRIEKIQAFDPTSGRLIEELNRVIIFPAKHYITTMPRIRDAVTRIEEELSGRVQEFKAQSKLLEAQRLQQRTRFDIEMLLELGHCPGIENYSMHLSGRQPGERPFCLLDFFPRDFLTVIDESHVTIPQINGMYEGDRSRKQTLVDYGFRLPSALENRPLRFAEFQSLVGQVICISATPGDWELDRSRPRIVEQIVRPTGIVDPKVTVRPAQNQVDDLIERIRERVAQGERVLVTTLTKRMAEDLAHYLNEIGIRVRYLHSEIEALERVTILRQLRLGEFDVLVGINLLREGLDLPEVALVAILDADREGFLRSARSLIQTAGRAARNVRSEVILYADHMTESMQRAVTEMDRRRERQLEFNRIHGITPVSIVKTAAEIMQATSVADRSATSGTETVDPVAALEELHKEMAAAVADLEFERAAKIRDRIRAVQRALELAEGRKRYHDRD